MPIVVRIDIELAKRKMSVGEFSERVGLTPANIAVLKNGRAKAVRFSTLEAMCRVLDCQPGGVGRRMNRHGGPRTEASEGTPA
jgi:putative transcriptional regulator